MDCRVRKKVGRRRRKERDERIRRVHAHVDSLEKVLARSIFSLVNVSVHVEQKSA
jgi:hypothetical protein